MSKTSEAYFSKRKRKKESDSSAGINHKLGLIKLLSTLNPPYFVQLPGSTGKPPLVMLAFCESAEVQAGFQVNSKNAESLFNKWGHAAQQKASPWKTLLQASLKRKGAAHKNKSDGSQSKRIAGPREVMARISMSWAKEYRSENENKSSST